MAFSLNGSNLIEYFILVQEVLFKEKDYITTLDSATGDGDHWFNLNSGFQEVVLQKERIKDLPLKDIYKSVGMILLSKVGGASGVLYGCAYLEAGRVCEGITKIDLSLLCKILEGMTLAIMKRGKVLPGQKTMIDAIHPAWQILKKGLEENIEEKELLLQVKNAAIDGAHNTEAMEAVKGRACYQANKGKGNIDPGAMTMAIQIGTLVDYLLDCIC